jgi:hypothetical protein
MRQQENNHSKDKGSKGSKYALILVVVYQKHVERPTHICLELINKYMGFPFQYPPYTYKITIQKTIHKHVHANYVMLSYKFFDYDHHHETKCK